eukprot:NODE_6204_length_465_cov_81.403846_g4695_i0.p4 GENE.NODE_6204_length_465_cov_81.403846_g4695_i0~~NODE_6204_length_465_cov_81.403846_g4695_i0.p4  ORF type:complete len:77 (-),score=33.20 NODE_6204_length_465_cov_81.403846_g4695_i0:234-440(-)
MGVFVTFQGTDSDGRRLLSGNKNPLNFRAFAMGGVYDKIQSARNDLPTPQIPDIDWSKLPVPKVGADD